MTNIDLHIHSTCSDGLCSPKQIIDIAKENNVTTISITDHDTILAYTHDLFVYAKEKGIKLIPGVEMSTKAFGVGIHVLGYNIDLKNEQLLNCLSLLKNARLDYLKNVSNKLMELGYIVNHEKLQTLTTVTKAHIATDVVENEKNKELLLKTFSHIPSMGEFIETIMNENCPAYVKKYSISPAYASKIIKEAGGKAILAHPTCYIHEDNLSLEQINTIVKEMKADGIEANYLYVDYKGNKFNDSSTFNKYAKENNLLATIGSDFHKFDEIHHKIGYTNTDFTISKEEIDKLKKELI